MSSFLISRYLLKLSLMFTLVLATMNFAARTLGDSQPPKPGLRGFAEGCAGKPQPCWYGIVPGVTPDWEILTLLDGAGYDVDDVVSGPNRQLQAKLRTNRQCYMLLNIELRTDTAYSLTTNCLNLDLGHFFQLRGFPDSLCVYYNSVGLLYNDRGSLQLTLSRASSFTPFSPIDGLQLNKNALRSGMKWVGFKSLRYYLEVLYPPPDSTVCYG